MITLGLAQIGTPPNDDLEELLRQTFTEAARAGVDLLIFPEGLMTWWQKTPEEYQDTAEPLDGPFYTLISSLCCEFMMACVYCANEHNDDGTVQEPALPYNTAVIVDKGGSLRGAYRKIHLFNSSTVRESDHNASGCAYMDPVDLGFARVGMGICYDLRFPALARTAALQGAQILLYPAAWYDGPEKLEHWRTLLDARAIENELFTVGVCRSNSNCVGHSRVVDPRGRLIAEAGEGEQLLIAQIDLNAVAAAREAIPVLDYEE